MTFVLGGRGSRGAVVSRPVPVYSTRLSLPLIGRGRESVFERARAALADDGRALDVREELPAPGPVGHVDLVVELAAPSHGVAHAIVAELHQIALRAVLASVPADGPQPGWTSGFERPDLASK